MVSGGVIDRIFAEFIGKGFRLEYGGIFRCHDWRAAPLLEQIFSFFTMGGAGAWGGHLRRVLGRQGIGGAD